MSRLPLAAALVLVMAIGAQADDGFERLRALDDTEHPRHEEAATRWEGTSKREQVELLRRFRATENGQDHEAFKSALLLSINTVAALPRRSVA